MFKSLSKSKELHFSKMKKFFGTNFDYDLVVIGGGPAGYIGSIKAGQKGLKTACVEYRGALGGTCLNVGCIPSKALLNISQKYHEAHHSYKDLGINIGQLSFDLNHMMNKKQKIVDSLTKGIEMLFKKNKVDYIKGYGKFQDENTLIVEKADGTKQIIRAKNYMIATGSEANNLPGGILPIDENRIISSTGIFIKFIFRCLKLKRSTKEINCYWRRCHRTRTWKCLP